MTVPDSLAAETRSRNIPPTLCGGSVHPAHLSGRPWSGQSTVAISLKDSRSGRTLEHDDGTVWLCQGGAKPEPSIESSDACYCTEHTHRAIQLVLIAARF